MSIGSKNKSICFVIPNWATGLGTGGAELQCYYISEELLKKGWNVEILVQKKDAQTFMSNLNFHNESIKIHMYKKTSSRILNILFIFFKLLRTKSKYYYNRTDAKLLRGTCGLYCKMFSKKMIFAIANDSDIVDESIAKKYTRKKNKKVKDRIKAIEAQIAYNLIRPYIFNANSTLTQTLFQQKLLKQKLNIDSTVIRNSFKNPIKNVVEKENIILWISNIRPQKQPELVGKLINKLDLGNWKVVMIGNYKGYEDIISQINHPNFKALGSLPFTQVLDWLNKSKVLINTSSSEGFPNSFIQAWFLKVLVISYSFDPDMLLRDKKIGFCANGDFSEFVSLVQNQINSNNSQAICEKAYIFAEEQFNIDKNIEKFLSTTIK